MNSISEQELRDRLGSELHQAQEYQPHSRQDAVFQENLDAQLSKQKVDSVRVKHPWFVAAMVVIAVGVVAVFGRGYFSYNQATPTIAELIQASNQIESELATYDKNQLDSLQYVEALKIRDDIGELDSTLNNLYQIKPDVSDERIQMIWQQRLEMARHLKAIYTNEYVVARI